MSSPTLLSCRGINLLKVGECANSEQEKDVFVSVHQLSLYLWELFKVPRGSVQKKIRDLGITLYPCNREGVQILRDQCVISAYKACQLKLREAELVFDAVQKSRQRRIKSEKRKQENAEKRWLQKVKKGLEFPAGLESGDNAAVEENGLAEFGAVDEDSVDGCVLYRTPSPPTSVGSPIIKGEDSLSDGKIEDSIESELGLLIGGTGDPFEHKNKDELNHYGKGTMAVSKNAISGKNELHHFNKVSSWNGKKKYKKVSCKRKTAEKLQPVRKKRKGSVNGQYRISPSPVSYSSDDSFVLESSGMDRFSSDEDQEIEDSVGKKKKYETKQLKILVREPKPLDKDSQMQPPIVNKRIVKLRHFAKNTSPKVKTTISRPPCPSAGKRFPSVTGKSKCRSLVVSIPTSVLNDDCKKFLGCATSIQMPNSTLVWRASSSEKKRQMKFKGKVKETALSMFASKKRASTHTPPPYEHCSEKHPKLTSSLDPMHSLHPPSSPQSLPSKTHKPRSSSSKSSFSSSSNSPQPVTPHSGVDFPGGDFDNISLASLESTSTSKKQNLDEGLGCSSAALKQSSLSLQKRQKLQNCLGKSEEFCFRKHFDFIPPKLVVRNGELCPQTSLSLKGIKFNDIPRDHPIWTWKVGQPTKKALPSFKHRTTQSKTLKSKALVL